MRQLSRERLLRAVLTIFGLVSVFGVYPLMRLWPTGWRWEPFNPTYEHMLVGVYATLGVFLLIAARRPEQHRSLILFTGWSSLVHGGVMGIDAAHTAGGAGHLVGDVPVIVVGGALLLLLAPPSERRRDA